MQTTTNLFSFMPSEWKIFFLIVIFLLGPAVLIFATSRSKILDAIGVVILSYIAGVLLGNIGFTDSSTLSIQKTFSEVSVALALPLLLFSMDIPKAFRNAGKAMLAMAFAAISVVTVATVMALTLGSHLDHGADLAGMAVGLYTGGTPNLASIKTALQVPDQLYIKFHTYDTVLGLIYLLFVFSVARAFYSKFMKSEKPADAAKINVSADDSAGLGIEDYGSLLYKKEWPPIFIALLLSALIVGISALIGSLVPKDAEAAVTILCITSLGIAASFIPAVRRIRKAFSVGMYIILIFCISVASLTDAMGLANIDGSLAIFIVSTIIGSMLLHSLLCKLANIDVDTFLIVSVSAICSPPFVPPAAGSIKRNDLIPIGLTTGIIGYGIGNYLGIALSYLLK